MSPSPVQPNNVPLKLNEIMKQTWLQQQDKGRIVYCLMV